MIDNGRDGTSQPFTLARIIRLPQIEHFSMTGDSAPAGMEPYILIGENLEMIAKAGWDETNDVDITALPKPLPGPGQKQSLALDLPTQPDASQANLYIWLRGDTKGRLTTIQHTPRRLEIALNQNRQTRVTDVL